MVAINSKYVLFFSALLLLPEKWVDEAEDDPLSPRLPKGGNGSNGNSSE
jgi:hypothetical protein